MAKIMQIVAHMMPDLPNVGMERDIEGFKVLFLVDSCFYCKYHPEACGKTCDLIRLIGILRKPRVPHGRAEDLPDAGDSWDGLVRAVEDRPLQELPSGRAHRPRREVACAGPALDACLSHSAVVGFK